MAKTKKQLAGIYMRDPPPHELVRLSERDGFIRRLADYWNLTHEGDEHQESR